MLPVNVQAAFNDVDEAGPYAQAITHLYEYGILNGKADGQFAPDDALTRAELAKIATVVSNADLSLSAAACFPIRRRATGPTAILTARRSKS